MTLIAKHITIIGKVQGVFFRKATSRIATELKIKGWVKNTNDGNVEIYAFANEMDLSKFINWCKHGPPNAAVRTIEIKDASIVSGINHFSIKY